MTITQREVARSLNVSPSTVSKVFRNAPDICSETKAKILAGAAQLGYKSPLGLGASTLKRRSDQPESRFVGVFYCHDGKKNASTSHNNVLYLDGLSEAAHDAGASLIIEQISGDGSALLDPEQQPVAMRNGVLSGLVLIYHFEEEVVRRLAEAMPVVTVTHWVPGAQCDHVDSDHIAGVQNLVAHLKNLGHRRIGYVARRFNYSFELSRFSSFHRALTHESLEFVPDACIVNKEDMLDPVDAAKIIAGKLSDGVTAWLCSTDMYAFQIIGHLEKMGIDVPGQVSITGFDNFESVQDIVYSKKLTTVKTRFRDMGYVALERLFQRIGNPALPPMQMMLDCPLVVGETTASVNGRHQR